MPRPRHVRLLATAGAAAALPLMVLPVPAASAAPGTAKHVIYISVDGLHQADLATYIATYPTSTLAQLVQHGTEYANARTTSPSDSFPGTLAPFTGATSAVTGVYYDDSYDRTLYPPSSNCQGPVGTAVNYDESDDIDAASGTRQILGETLDVNNLPERLNNDGTCTPVYPGDFVGANTVFQVAASHGLYTAYSDKHPAYQIVEGPGGRGVINDLFTPEINADIIPSSLTVSRGGSKTDTVDFPVNQGTYGNAYIITDSVADTESYDQLKVDALLNQIDGLRSDGSATTPSAGTVPAISGFNFQSVSVGEKLVDPLKSCKRPTPGVTCDPSYQPGGYQPGSTSAHPVFTPQLLGALNYVDASLGSIVQEIDDKGLAASTEIIVSAKHGQSPVDPSTLDLAGDLFSGPNSDTSGPNAYLGGASVARETSDDVGLIWLADSTEDASAAQSVIANASADKEAVVYQGGTQPTVAGAQSTYPMFGYPAPGSLQAARQPDIIVQPQAGTIYSHSKAKVEEHGGFSPDDTTVPIVVDAAVPTLTAAGAPGSGSVVTSAVTTTQIAPTILQSLGLDYHQLTGAVQQNTQPLPVPSPPTPLPEAPATAALAGIGGLVLAGGYLVARRRRA